jgi:excinuclease ABC subunit B
MGRAARNVNGRVIMYADRVTNAMKHAISETTRRRAVQEAYNAEHGIVPQTVVRAIMNVNPASGTIDYLNVPKLRKGEGVPLDGSGPDMQERLAEMRLEMFTAAENLEFEKAARLRDELKKLEAIAGLEAGNGNGGEAFDPYASSGKRKSGPVKRGAAKASGARGGKRMKAR